MSETGALSGVDASLQRPQIVVADDSPIYRKLVESVLAPQGYTILFARNGREALESFSRHQPFLIITDWEMPDITGIQLCKEIRHACDRYVYVILLTSNAEKDQVIEGLAAGADDYLTKPFHSGELLARVGVGRRVVELHHQIQQKNQQLQELALTDPLTNLPNRRAIQDWAQHALNGAARHGFSFWVVMADLDHFKSINDTYGHEAGDIVIKRFAELLRANTRSSNMCGRIGGEEFLLGLAHANKQGVLTAVERIRHQLEVERFIFGGRTTKITASFGAVGFEGHHAPDLDDLFRSADMALYAAKHLGRNRLEFAPTALS